MNETKLSAVCSLHAASASTSSSTSSLRRRRLIEIAEEEEEEQRASKRQSIIQRGSESRSSSPIPMHNIKPDPILVPSLYRTSFCKSQDPPIFVGVDRPLSLKMQEAKLRLSSQSAHPDFYISYGNFSKSSRLKVKLAPRPSLDSRPHTAENYRPKSALPAGFKIFSRKGISKERNELEEMNQEILNKDVFGAAIPNTRALQTLKVTELVRPHTGGGSEIDRPSTSSTASVKSFNMISGNMLPPKENKISQEKERLLKALRLREKKKHLAALEMQLEEHDTEQSNKFYLSKEPHFFQTGEQEADSPLGKDDKVRTDYNSANRFPFAKADSGIAIEVASPSCTNFTLSETQLNSHPNTSCVDHLELVSKKLSSIPDSNNDIMEPEREKLHGVEIKHNARTEADVGTEIGAEKFIESPTENNGNVTPTVISINLANGNTAVDKTYLTEDQESKLDAHSTLVLPCGITPPVSKFAVGIPDSSEDGLRMECHAAEVAIPRQENPTPGSWMIPVSKFSTHEPTVLSTSKTTKMNTQRPSRDKSCLTNRQSLTHFHSIEPIQIDIVENFEISQTHLSEDDLIEELQSATLQEATHITVSKSPITPVFPSLSETIPDIADSSSVSNRATSNPIPIYGPPRAPSDMTQNTTRSVSSGAAFLHKMTQQHISPSLTSKPGKIGSSISQRIKALEKLSAHNGLPETLQPPPRTQSTASTLISVRKNSSRDSSHSSVLDPASHLSPDISSNHFPEARRGSLSRDRTASVASRLSIFEAAGSNVSQQPPSAPPSRGRTESIQVTARIVRDQANPYPSISDMGKELTDLPAFELKQSPLVVDVHRSPPMQVPGLPMSDPLEMLPTPPTPKETIQQRRKSKDKRQSRSVDRSNNNTNRRSSLSIVKDFIKERRNSTAKSPNSDSLLAPVPNTGSRSPSQPPSTHQNTFSPGRLSMSSRRSSFSRENSTEALSPLSGNETSTSGDEKDRSKKRGSRFIRRLSASISGTRKNLTPNISPTVREEAAEINTSQSYTTASQQSTIVFMGEVNVQFPDTLLWKRRSMCLDSQGFLIISTIQGKAAEKYGTGVKRYHLSDFRLPFIPDVEIQELPNSVVLEFMEGSGLQVACEDRAGQLNVLHTLQQAHQKHISFGQ